MKKRLVSFILAVVMLITLSPMSAVSAIGSSVMSLNSPNDGHTAKILDDTASSDNISIEWVESTESKHKLRWTIKVNETKKSTLTDVSVVMFFKENGLIADEESFAYTKNGSKYLRTGCVHFSEDNEKATIYIKESELGSPSYFYTISFDTFVIDPLYWATNSTHDFSMTAELNSNEGTETCSAKKTYTSEMIAVEQVANSTDYSNNAIQWKISYNQNEIELADPTVLLTVPANQILLTDDLDDMVFSGEIKAYNCRGTLADGSVQYMLYLKDNDNSEDSLVVKTYVTSQEILSKNKTSDLTLQAKLGGKIAGEQVVPSDNAIAITTGQFSNTFLKLSGEAEAENPYIDWQTILNAGRAALNNSIFEIDISENLFLDVESMALYKVSSVSSDGTVFTKGEVVSKEDYSVSVSGNTLILTMPNEISCAYIFEYKTGVTQASSYTSTVRLKDTSSSEYCANGTVDASSLTPLNDGFATVKIFNYAQRKSGKEAICGGGFSLTLLDQNDAAILTYTLSDTDANGITSLILPYGKYRVQQLYAADDYEKGDEEYIEDIDINEETVDEQGEIEIEVCNQKIHVHNFTYSVPDDAKNTFIASCEEEDCELTDSKIVLTLSAEGGTYSGDSFTAALTGEDDFITVTGATVGEVEYYQSNTLLEGAPTNAGTYTAKVTVNYGEEQSAILVKEFTIDPATPYITEVPSVPRLIKGDTLSTLTISDGEVDTAGSFSWKDGSSSVSGDYILVFTPEDSLNYTSAECTVHVDVISPWKALGWVLSSYSYLVSKNNGYFSWEKTKDADDKDVITVTLKKNICNDDKEGAIIFGNMFCTTIFDLYGYTIDGNKAAIFSVTNGNLVIQDSSALESGKIVNGQTDDYGGAVSMSGGSFTLEGGTISACSASDGGGAVSVKGGSFTMNGGAITNCSAGGSSHGGGAVYVNDYGEFTMLGGSIYNNIIYCNYSGGGVYIGENSSFTMLGGSITGNKTQWINNYGGGVAGYGQVTLGGTAVIRDNLRAMDFGHPVAGDLYIGSPTSHPLAIATEEDAPKDGMDIGIILNEGDVGIGYGVFSGECADYTNRFFASDSNCRVCYSDGKLALDKQSMNAVIEDGKIKAGYVSLTKESVTFFAALYDADQRMLGVGMVTITTTTGSNLVEITLPDVEGTVASYRLIAVESDTCVPVDSAVSLTQ